VTATPVATPPTTSENRWAVATSTARAMAITSRLVATIVASLTVGRTRAKRASSTRLTARAVATATWPDG
jgi:hypothetical protein